MQNPNTELSKKVLKANRLVVQATMKSLGKYQNVVEDLLQELDKEWNDLPLYNPIRHILSNGGKRLRPVLTLMANDFFDGNLEQAYLPALGIELFHNFTLLQDDIMDEAPLRRGKPTSHILFGENETILSSDVMFAKAFSLATSCPERYLRKVLDLFNTTAVEVCEGQHLDMAFEKRTQVSIDEYIHMIGLKTAVIVGCALKLGAILADATDKDAQFIYDFGMNLGIAYQIQDDILDVFGNQTEFGKQVGGDIIANKKTYLLIKALEDANMQQKAALNYWLEETQFEASEKVEAITSIFAKLQIKEQAESVMWSYYNKAVFALESITVKQHKKDGLLAFAKVLMKRSF